MGEILPALCLAAVLGYLAGWWRRAPHPRRGALAWWEDGFRAGFVAGIAGYGRNPLHKPTTFATLDELAPHVIEGDSSQ